LAPIAFTLENKTNGGINMSDTKLVQENNGCAKCPYCGTIIEVAPRTREQKRHIQEIKPVIEMRKKLDIPFAAHLRGLICPKCNRPFLVADKYSVIYKGAEVMHFG
jgi:DNA-directed RNA polymerase subunit RPC12/RpoP